MFLRFDLAFNSPLILFLLNHPRLPLYGRNITAIVSSLFLFLWDRKSFSTGSNTIKKEEEDCTMAEDCTMVTSVEAASSLSGVFLVGGDQNG